MLHIHRQLYIIYTHSSTYIDSHMYIDNYMYILAHFALTKWQSPQVSAQQTSAKAARKRVRLLAPKTP